MDGRLGVALGGAWSGDASTEVLREFRGEALGDMPVGEAIRDDEMDHHAGFLLNEEAVVSVTPRVSECG